MARIIKGGTVVNGDWKSIADIRMDGEKIIAIGQLEAYPEDEIIDATGKLVFPGFIDTHTHFDMCNGVTTTADNFDTGTTAAIAGGTTCILDFATQEKNETLQQGLQNWIEKTKGNCSCDYGFHMAISNWNPHTSQELDAMRDYGITSYKMYMAYSNLRVDDGALYEIFKRIDQVDGIAGIHCENGDLIDAITNEQLALGHNSPRYHGICKPHQLEAEAIHRCLAIAKLAGVPVNIVHLTCADGLDEIRTARASGQTVFAESCPQYLLLNEDKYQLNGDNGFEAAKYVFSPPLRSQEHADALWNALTHNEINTIGTDHCSFNYHGQKDLGREDYRKIPNGIPGVEHRPILMYTYGVQSGRISLEQFVKALSENPAKLFGMYPRKGVIAPGSDADIVIWNPNQKGIIQAATQLQNVDYTPYEGMETIGQVEQVFLRGNCVVQNGKVIKKGLGNYIKRGPSGRVNL